MTCLKLKDEVTYAGSQYRVVRFEQSGDKFIPVGAKILQNGMTGKLKKMYHLKQDTK